VAVRKARSNGAGSAANNEVYNRQLDKSEKNAIANKANGNPVEVAKLTSAACYAVQCWAQYPVGSAEYNANYVSQAELIGLQPELDWVASQQSQGLFQDNWGAEGDRLRQESERRALAEHTELGAGQADDGPGPDRGEQRQLWNGLSVRNWVNW